MMGIVCEGTVHAEAEAAFWECTAAGYLSGLEGPGYGSGRGNREIYGCKVGEEEDELRFLGNDE